MGVYTVSADISKCFKFLVVSFPLVLRLHGRAGRNLIVSLASNVHYCLCTGDILLATRMIWHMRHTRFASFLEFLFSKANVYMGTAAFISSPVQILVVIVVDFVCLKSPLEFFGALINVPLTFSTFTIYFCSLEKC